MKTRLCLLLPLLALLAFAGCGRSDSSATAKSGTAAAVPKKARTPNPQALAYYKANPKFFLFKTPADLPSDLKWENGSHLPEFGDPAAKRGGTEYRAIETFPPTIRYFGPEAGSGFRSFLHDYNHPSYIYPHPNADGWIPGLCESWAVAPDSQTVYFRLYKDAVWSDGVPLTTDDIIFMYYLYQSPLIQAPFLNNFYSTEFESVTKFDDYTFAVKLIAPRPNVIEYAGYQQYAEPEHFYVNLDNDFPQKYQWKIAPTLGPYTINEGDIEQGRSITQTRVANWWGNDKPFFKHRFNPDRLVYQLVRDRDKAFEMFKLGEVDVFNMLVPPKYWYDQMNIPEVEKGYIVKHIFHTYQSRAPMGLWLNSKKAPLDNRDVREGINYACNWDKVIQVSLRGDGRRMHVWADSHPPYEPENNQPRPFDIEKAVAAFARAGYTKRGPDGILVNDAGRRLSVTITFGSALYVDIPPILKEEAAKAGLEFVIEKLDPTAAFQKAMQKNHEIWLGGWVQGGTEYSPRFWEFFHGEQSGKPNTQNMTGTDIPELNAAIDAYRKSESKEELVRLSLQMIKMIYDDAAYIAGYTQPFIRWGAWRWVKYPAWLNVREAQYPYDFSLHWIDEDVKKETLQARRDGKSFGRQDRVDSKWKTD